MRTWGRVLAETLCGGCGNHIRVNAPAQFIALPNVKKEKVRGECCAGAAPPDLPQNPPKRTTSPMTPIRKIATGSTIGPKIWKRG